MTVNAALVPAHNSKHHNRSDSILAVSDNYSRFRVLSVDPTGYGAATSRFFTIYENFSGKIVSVLRKRLVRTVLIFTESSDQLSRATDRVPGLPASPG
ncbi:hypothetical protein ACKWMO_05890, partial [Escherichia coli]